MGCAEINRRGTSWCVVKRDLIVCGEINRRGTSWGVLRPIEEGPHGVW